MNHKHILTKLINYHQFSVVFLDLNQVKGFESRIKSLIHQLPNQSIRLLYLVASKEQQINQDYLDQFENKLTNFGQIIWEVKSWYPKLTGDNKLTIHKLVINHTKPILDDHLLEQLITYYKNNYGTQEVVLDYYHPILLTDQAKLEKLLTDPMIQGISTYYAPYLFDYQRHLFINNLIVNYHDWRVVGWGDLIRMNYHNSYVQALARGVNYLGLSNHAISRCDDVYYHNTYDEFQEVNFLHNQYLKYWNQIQDELILYFHHDHPDNQSIINYLNSRKFFKNISSIFKQHQDQLSKWTVDDILVFLSQQSIQDILLSNFDTLLKQQQQLFSNFSN